MSSERPNQNQPKKKKPFARSEHSEQSDVIRRALLHLNVYPDLRWLYSVPNGATLPASNIKAQNGKVYRSSRTMQKLKQEGLNPGVPDLALPVAKRSYHGMYVEMKREDGKVSREQEAWKEHLVGAGYYHVIAYNAEEAWSHLVWYVKGKPTRIIWDEAEALHTGLKDSPVVT